MVRFTLFLLALPLLAQTGLSVKQTSNTGFAIEYTAADDTTPYTVEVSELADYSVLLYDVNPALYADSNMDLSRPDTITNGNVRGIQIGHTGRYFQALDGSARHRVACAVTHYYVRINGTAEIQVDTDNINPNIVGTQGMPVRGPFENDRPSMNPAYNTYFCDAITGVRVSTLPNPFGTAWASYTGPDGFKFGGAVGSGWSSTSGALPSALALDDNVYAETSTQDERLLSSQGHSQREMKLSSCTAANPTVCTLNGVAPESLYANQSLRINGATYTTTLATTINDSITTIIFTSAGGFSTGVTFLIEDERISCTTLIVNTFSGCTRGLSGTTPAAHTSGVTITGFGLAGDWVLSAVSGTDITVPFDGTGFTYTADSGSIRFSTIPGSSSVSSGVSFYNLLLTADCTGCGSGIEAAACYTWDGVNCSSQVKTFMVGSSESTITVCQPYDNSDPCDSPLLAGDFWSYDVPGSLLAMARDRVWNGASGGCSGGTMLCFTSLAGCEARHINDRVRFWQGSSGANATIVATDCGASPPSVTMDGAWLADGNGSTGIPYLYYSGNEDNFASGFLIWKKTSDAGTLRIDQTRLVIGSYTPVDVIATGSGGFPPRCSEFLTDDDRWLCAAPGGIWSLKTDANGNLDAKWLGYPYFSNLGLGVQAGFYGPETFTWSGTEPNVFYMDRIANSQISPATGGLAHYMIRVELDTPDIACGDMGSSCTLPTLGVEQFLGTLDATFTNLTPCLNACSMVSDDYTLEGQTIRLNDDTCAYARFGGPGVKAVQGNFVLLQSNEVTADSFACYWSFDIGNGGIPGSTYVGSDGNTQQIYRVVPTFEALGFRWGADHTHSPAFGTDSHTIIEAGAKATYSTTVDDALTACSPGVDCGTCPSITVLGYNYTGQKRCDTVQLSSSYPSGGQTQPVWWESGDPVNLTCPSDICNPFWKALQKLIPGDRLTIGAGTGSYEVVQMVQDLGSNQWVIERGCGVDQSVFAPKNHTAGLTWSPFPVASDPICSQDPGPNFPLGMAWDWIGERTNWDLFVNHAFTAANARVNGGYNTQIADFTDWANVIVNIPAPNPPPASFATFAGVLLGPASPNSVEYHPGYQNWNASGGRNITYADAHPLLNTTSVTITNVSGDLYSYSAGSYGYHPRLSPLGSFQSLMPFQMGSSIDDTTDSWGKGCFAVHADDCFTGSSADTFYANGQIVEAYGCATNVEFWSGQMDTCPLNSILLSVSQGAEHLLPPSTGMPLDSANFRRLVSGMSYRGPATDNVKWVPDGYHFFQRGVYSGLLSAYSNVPVWPTSDGKDRSTFIPRTITVDAGDVPMSTAKARILFGYDGDFACNDNSGDGCWVVNGTINESIPFLWGGELSTGDGVSCASGCSIAIPQIEGRILRYAVFFIDSMGMSTGNLPISFDLGDEPPPSGAGGSVIRGNAARGGKAVSR